MYYIPYIFLPIFSSIHPPRTTCRQQFLLSLVTKWTLRPNLIMGMLGVNGMVEVVVPGLLMGGMGGVVVPGLLMGGMEGVVVTVVLILTTLPNASMI